MWLPLPCHRRPLACIFMKSLFRTTIHRDEQRTMTASEAEMRRWRLCEEEKKKRAWNGGGGGGGAEGETGIHSRGWCERARGEGGREAGGGGKARTPTRATFSRARFCVRSFVRFFVMTVDETMTYFSGFSLPGCPAAPPFTPPPVLFPRSAHPFAPEGRARRVRPGPPFITTPSRVSSVFLPARRALFFAHPSRLTLSSRVIYTYSV